MIWWILGGAAAFFIIGLVIWFIRASASDDTSHIGPGSDA